MPSNPNRPSNSLEKQAQYQAWLEKRDAENQANLERTGRPLMEKRGKKVKNAAESQHHSLNDLTTTAELSNLDPSKLNNDTLRELAEVGNTTSTESQHRPLNELTTAELFNLDHSELENSGLRELIEAQDRLRSEREQNATEKNDNIDPNEIFNMSGEEIDNLSNNLSSAAEFAEVIKALSAEHRAIIAKLEAKLANNPDGSKEGQTDIDKTVKTPESISPEKAEQNATEEAENVATTEVGNTTSTETEANSEQNAKEEAEQTSPEDASKTYEKAKKNSRARNFLNRKIVSIVLVAIIGLSSVVGISQYLNPNSATGATTVETTISQPTDDEEANEPGEEANETGEEYGIYDGYNETGMWNSENKANPLNFANAAEVAPLFDNDECDMVKYAARNQVECMADYMANFPEALQPEGFKGLSILETEQKLQSLSDEEFKAVQAQFEQTVGEAFTRQTTANGEQQNAYMRLIDSNKPATHDNMELVECTTNESNLEVTEFYWVNDDGNEIGSMTMKLTPVRDENNHIINFDGCMQIINPIGSKAQLYSGMETTPENPTNPGTPDVPDTPDRSKGSNTHAGEDQQSMGTTENTKGDAEREATADNNASNSNPGSEVDEVITDTTETNADHSGATRADNANTVEQETVDTSNQRGGGDNVDRSQEDLAKIVNGGGV